MVGPTKGKQIDLLREMQNVLDALHAESVEDEKQEREKDDPYGGSEVDRFREEYRRGMMYAAQKMKKVLILYRASKKENSNFQQESIKLRE